MSDAVMRAQGYADRMEHDMRRVFDDERYGFLGVLNADFIRKDPFAAVLATCGFIYAKADDKNKREIEKFINDTSFYWEMSLDELLSFETSSKIIGITETELDYENGEEALKDISNKFSHICDLAACQI